MKFLSQDQSTQSAYSLDYGNIKHLFVWISCCLYPLYIPKF